MSTQLLSDILLKVLRFLNNPSINEQCGIWVIIYNFFIDFFTLVLSVVYSLMIFHQGRYECVTRKEKYI